MMRKKRFGNRHLSLFGASVLCVCVGAVSSAQPVAAAERGGTGAVECSGVGWPEDYRSVTPPIELPTERLGRGKSVFFPETRLPPVDTQALLDEDEANAAPGKPLRVGVSRELIGGLLDGQWHEIDEGGAVWTAAVVSEGAFALRVRFTNMDLPPGAEVFVYSPGDSSAVRGPYTGTGNHNSGTFWAETVRGDTVHIEYYVPDGETSRTAFAIDQVGHMYRSDDGFDRSRGALTCMKDVACYPAWEDVSYSVAKITFYSNDPPDPPGWVNCSGQLITTETGDLTPYFLTAAHCVDEDDEAESLQCEWFYQHSSCGGPLMTSAYSSVAELMDAGAAPPGQDWSLLLIKGVLPEGVFWSGWTTDYNFPIGTSSVGVHHPNASWKRWSRGLYDGAITNYHRIDYDQIPNEGTIYFGSSGSGIWRESDQKLFGIASYFNGCDQGCDCLPDDLPDTYYARFSQCYYACASMLIEGWDDFLEDNDSCVEARPMTSGYWPWPVVKSVDEDWYSISIPAGQQLEVQLTFTTGHGNIDAQLYDACGGTVVADATSYTSNETLEYTNAGVTADFYLRVYLANDTRNTYEMTIGFAGASCADGILNQGEDRIDCGGPCPPCECLSDGACEDSLFCTGEDTCDEYGMCQSSGNPCPPEQPYCDEEEDQCVVVMARIFVLPAGVAPETTPPGTYTIIGGGGEDIVFDVWVENTDPASVRAWQVWFDCTAAGGAGGSVDFVSDEIDENRTDYIFYDLSILLPTTEHQGECDDPEYDPYTMGPRTFNACTDSGQYPVVTDPVYLSTWTFHVSTDATGTFTLRPYCAWGDGCTPPDRTYLVDANNDTFGFALDTLEVSVPIGQCCDGDTCLGNYLKYDCFTFYGGTGWNAYKTCPADDCGCSSDADCVEFPPSGCWACEPENPLTNDFGCVYHSRVFGDVYPVPDGDGAAEGFDILCILDAANSSNAFGCLDVLPTGLMAGDIYPCGTGDGAVEGFDILAVLDAANQISWCADPCP